MCICKSSTMIHCGNRSFLEVMWQMFEKKSKWKSNGGIIGSKAKSCCNGVQHHFLRARWLWMNRKMIGEVIYTRVSQNVEMCRPRVGETNLLFSLCRALWRSTALAKKNPEALKSLYRSPGYKKKQLVLCKNYVLQW